MKKGMPWASPSFDAWVFLKYAWVTHGGIPKLRLFHLLDHIISSPLLILENFLHTKLKVNFIRGLVHKKFLYSAWTQLLPMLLDISYSHWYFMEQKDPFKIVKEALQNKWQNLSKTEQTVKSNFFEALNLLRSENFNQMKVAYTSKDCAKNREDFYLCSNSFVSLLYCIVVSS